MRKQRWPSPNGHPDPNLILMLLEGELESADSLDVAQHLRTCWQCRAYSEQVQRGIVAFVEYRKESFLPELPLPPRGWRTFTFRLQRAIKAFEACPPTGTLLVQSALASWLKDVLSFSSVSRSLSRVSRPGWISAAVSLITILALVRFSLFQPPEMQAAEFLRRAVAATPASKRPGSVLYERVRVRRGDSVFDRVIADGGKAVANSGTNSVPDRSTQAAMSLIGMDWRMPLSAERFSDWRDALPQKEDHILESKSSLTLRTTPENGPRDEVRSASLTVNKSDWRPIAEHVEFRNQPALDVTEVSFELRALPASIVAGSNTPSNTRNSIVSLPDTELAARFALHRIGADLGEPVDVRAGVSGSGLISVSGTVASDARKQEIIVALKGVPHVAPKIQTEAEAAPRELPAPATQAEPLIVTMRSPIEKELLEHFGNPAAVEDFSKQAIAITGELMSRAWALRHLSERYGLAGSKEDAVLSLPSRKMLQTMRQDHHRAMSEAASELSNLMRPVLSSVVRSVPEPPTRLSLFAATQEVQRLTQQILSGSGASGPDRAVEPEKAAHDLLIALRGLENALEEQP